MENHQTNNNLEYLFNISHKKILRIFWPDMASKKEVERLTGRKNISDGIKIRRWRWIGHVLRMEDQDIPKGAMCWTPDGERRVGRPRET